MRQLMTMSPSFDDEETPLVATSAPWIEEDTTRTITTVTSTVFKCLAAILEMMACAADIRYVFLLLAAENARSYLYSLASLAQVFQDKSHMERLAAVESLKEFRKEVKQVFSGEGDKPKRRHNHFNNLFLREAAKIAKGANCIGPVKLLIEE